MQSTSIDILYNSLFIYLFIYRTAESANPDDICRALGLCYRQKGQKLCALYKKTVKVGYHDVSATSITACLGWKFIFATHAGATIIFIIQYAAPASESSQGLALVYCIITFLHGTQKYLLRWQTKLSQSVCCFTMSLCQPCFQDCNKVRLLNSCFQDCNKIRLLNSLAPSTWACSCRNYDRSSPVFYDPCSSADFSYTSN